MFLELEKTYLAKYLPDGFSEWENKEIIDLYIPKHLEHSQLRIRKNGNKLEITKKIPLNGDVSSLQEFTIPLSNEEYNIISQLDGKKIHKTRYCYDYNWYQAEIDVFQWDLHGLVLIDFEFDSEEKKNSFMKPDFCLIDVTEEEFIAGWILCGKKYKDIEERLKWFWYNKFV